MKLNKNFFYLAGCAAILCGSILYYNTSHSAHNLQKQALLDHVEFDEAMGAAQYPEKLTNPQNQQVYQAFKHLYQKNNLASMKPSNTTKIPKIIHIMAW